MWSDILLCFLGYGIARFLSLRPASRAMRVTSRSDRGLPRGLIVGCLEVRSRVASRSVRVALRSYAQVASRSVWVASSSVRVASRSYRRLPRGPCGLPRGLIAGCLEVCAGCLEVPSRVASRSHVHVASGSQGTNFETKIFNFRWVFGPFDRNEL